MNEERRMILEMLQTGSISVEEAEKLLEAVPKEGESPLANYEGRMPNRLLVLVTENDKPKVNVRVPFSLVRVGLKLGKSFGALGAKYAKDSEDIQALEMLNDLDIDELLASIMDGEIQLPYVIVDMDEAETGQTVRVVLE